MEKICKKYIINQENLNPLNFLKAGCNNIARKKSQCPYIKSYATAQIGDLNKAREYLLNSPKNSFKTLYLNYIIECIACNFNKADEILTILEKNTESRPNINTKLLEERKQFMIECRAYISREQLLNIDYQPTGILLKVYNEPKFLPKYNTSFLQQLKHLCIENSDPTLTKQALKTINLSSLNIKYSSYILHSYDENMTSKKVISLTPKQIMNYSVPSDMKDHIKTQLEIRGILPQTEDYLDLDDSLSINTFSAIINQLLSEGTIPLDNMNQEAKPAPPRKGRFVKKPIVTKNITPIKHTKIMKIQRSRLYCKDKSNTSYNGKKFLRYNTIIPNPRILHSAISIRQASCALAKSYLKGILEDSSIFDIPRGSQMAMIEDLRNMFSTVSYYNTRSKVIKGSFNSEFILLYFYIITKQQPHADQLMFSLVQEKNKLSQTQLNTLQTVVMAYGSLTCIKLLFQETDQKIKAYCDLFDEKLDDLPISTDSSSIKQLRSALTSLRSV